MHAALAPRYPVYTRIEKANTDSNSDSIRKLQVIAREETEDMKIQKD